MVIGKCNVEYMERRLPTSNKHLPYSVENLHRDVDNRIMCASKKNINVTTGILNPSCYNWDIESHGGAKKLARKQLKDEKQEGNQSSIHLANLQDYKAKTNTAKNAIKETKKESQQKYVNDIKNFTPIKDIWCKIRSIKNKQKIESNPIIQNDVMITNSKVKTDELAEHFKRNNSDTPLYSENECRQLIEEQIRTKDVNDEE